jgi:hypothetical protein
MEDREPAIRNPDRGSIAFRQILALFAGLQMAPSGFACTAKKTSVQSA